MAKIHKYVGLEGTKRIWEETGRKFIDNTELDYIINNMEFSMSSDNILVLKIPTKTGSIKQLTVDLKKITKDPLKIYLDDTQYDSNGKPNLSTANPNVIYLVPSNNSDNSNEYVEWMFDSVRGWEVIGGPSISDDDIYNIVNG